MVNIRRLCCIGLLLLFSACINPVPEENVLVKRVGMVTGIRPEKIDYYKQLHAATWEGVLKTIHAAHIRNYTIYLTKIDTAYYLFSHYEYVGNNYAADMKKIAADSVTQRWWRETAPCQIPLPEAAARSETWTEMEEVFHTD